MREFGRKIGPGIAWNLLSMLLSRGATTIFTLLLARLLAPEAFGLIAMMMIVLELAQNAVQSGLGQALIRSKDVSDEDLSTIFFANLGLSILAYGALYAAAPYLADFYSQADLISLLRTMGLVVFLSAIRTVPTALLSRQMNFRTQMIANTTGVIVSGMIAVLLAWQGAGVWSLVGQSLVMAGISTLILWQQSKWMPLLVFSTKSFQRLFGFGVNLLITGSLQILVQNSQVIAIGRLFSAEVTGLYFFARKLTNLISHQLSGAVQSATFPALATLQDDNAQLRQKYRKIIQLMMFIIAPIMALLAALAEPLFDVLLGDNWTNAVVYVQLLCIVATLYPLHAMNINVLNVKGRSDLVLKIGLFKNATSLLFLFLTIPYGVFWIVVGQVANSFLSLIPNTYFTVRLIDYGVKQQMLDIAKPIFAGAIGGVFAHQSMQVFNISAALTLGVSALVGALAFFLTAMVTKTEAFVMLRLRASELLKWR